MLVMHIALKFSQGKARYGFGLKPRLCGCAHGLASLLQVALATAAFKGLAPTAVSCSRYTPADSSLSSLPHSSPARATKLASVCITPR